MHLHNSFSAGRKTKAITDEMEQTTQVAEDWVQTLQNNVQCVYHTLKTF